MSVRANPIPIATLWENFWVFTLYGLVLGLCIGGMSVLDVDLTKVQTLMTEPLSFYAFSALSLVGLLGLGIANVTVAPNAQAMHSSAWVRNFWVPIANAGLSTGAIIMGMMFGLAIGLSPWIFSDPKVWHLSALLFAMSAFVLAVLYPLTLLKRSLFDSDKDEEHKSTVAGVLYCVVLSLAFWHIDRTRFWSFIAALGITSIFIGLLIHHLSKKRRPTLH